MSGRPVFPKSSDALCFFDQPTKYTHCFCHDLGNLRQRWDDQLILERCSLAELYLNGRLEIVLHGDWGIGADQYRWACRIKTETTIVHDVASNPRIEPRDCRGDDSGDKEVVLIVFVEGVKVPKMLVGSILRPYLFEKKVFGTGEGLLYRCESAMGYEVFPWGKREIEWSLRGRSPSPDDPICKMIKCSPEISDRVSNDSCKRLWDVLFGTVGYTKTIGVYVQDRSASYVIGDFIEGSIKRDRSLTKFINVAVGPLNL